MAGSTFGKNFTITTWGESHGPAIGAVIDGVPAGLPLTEADLMLFLDRRKPGVNPYGTKRKESDSPEILSGVFEGITSGTPISVLVRNCSQISQDYQNIADVYRPGHADFCYDEKYGFRDYRGGGRSSGRETIGRVIGGAIASKILKALKIEILCFSRSIGPFSTEKTEIKKEDIFDSPLYLPDPLISKQAEQYLQDCMSKKDSAGGVIECQVKGMPAGIGEPVFDKLDANLSKALMSIGAVKAVEIGDGVLASKAVGSENNDSFTIRNEKPEKRSNHSGGILGGISDGSDIILRAHFKPTPSISSLQSTISKSHKEVEIEIKGRHDPIIVPRAVVVVESMVAITILDALIDNMSARMDSITNFYQAGASSIKTES